MSYTLVPSELIVDGAITSAKLDTNISISGTLGVTGELTLATHLNMGDNDKIKIGAGGDLEIYHDGSNSYIANSTGNIYIADTNGAVHIQAKLNEESIVATADGAVTLYHDNSAKLATASGGVTVTGTLTATTLAGTLSTAAQTNITSVGTLTGFTSTGIDDNADATAITIDSSENVGIGASSALDNKLEVNGGDIRVRGTSTPTLKLNNGDQEVVGMRLQSGATGNLSFHTDKMVIDNSGKVGIGTASPSCQSGGIHAVHANAEGTPTFDGGEVLILQRNFNSAQSCSMSMVAGTNAACTINMGDKDDVNRSFITSHQGTDTMGFTVATGSALEIVSGRGGGSGRTVSATGNGGLCFGAATTNTGGCIMAAADNAQSEGIVFYLTASACEWQPASIIAHCSKIDSDQSDHNYGNVAYGFSILGNGSLATVQKYEENPSGGAGITWSLNDLGGTTTMQIQILATSNNSTGPRIVLSAWAANYSGVLEANRS